MTRQIAHGSPEEKALFDRIKDMGIALEEARRRGLTLPGLALAHQLYEKVTALGHGRSGTHALMLALEALSQKSPDGRPAAP